MDSAVMPPFTANAVRLQLHALAYNLGNFLRKLATPEPIKEWSLTTLNEKLIKIGAKVIGHARYVAFQMAEPAIPETCSRTFCGCSPNFGHRQCRQQHSAFVVASWSKTKVELCLDDGENHFLTLRVVFAAPQPGSLGRLGLYACRKPSVGSG